jgi:DHA1 family bicyclomycin/chloramphenicol resistance-like MFS transporter
LKHLRILSVIATIGRHGGFRAYLAMMSLTYGGLFAWISASSFILQGLYGFGELVFALAFAVGVVGYIAGTVLAQRLVSAFGVERTLAVGAAMLAAAGLAMLALVPAEVDPWIAIVAPMALYLCGVGLVMPQSMAGALTPFPRRAGSASSLAGFVQMMVGALIGIGVGAALGTSPMPLPITVAATGLATLALVHLSRRARIAGAVPRPD